MKRNLFENGRRKTNEVLEKLDQKFSNERLYEVLYKLDIEDVYAEM